MFVGVDIGGTSMRALAVHEPLAVGAGQPIVAPIGREYAQGLTALCDLIAAACPAPTAIGVSIAGTIAPGADSIQFAGAITDWVDKPLRDDLGSVFGCPVVLANDAKAAALGEAHHGDVGGDFWFIIWGTGLGGTLVARESGTIVLRPGEPGHQVIEPTDSRPPDACGRHGCLESFVGGGSIERRYGKRAAELSEPEWDQVCEHLAQGLYNLQVAAPVDAFVMGGGISIKQAHRLAMVEGWINERMQVQRAPQVVVSACGERAGLYGALALLA